MTGAAGSAGRPLASRPEDGSVNTVVVKYTTGRSTSRPCAATECEPTNR
jgi:hypothetical protein